MQDGPPATSSTRYWRDVIERVIRAYIVAVGTLLVADATNFQDASHLLNAGKSAAIAAAAPVISLLISLAAKGFGNADSASLQNGV